MNSKIKLLEHEHIWYEVESELFDAEGNNTDIEIIYWCHNCDATKDSDGGIIL